MPALVLIIHILFTHQEAFLQ